MPNTETPSLVGSRLTTTSFHHAKFTFDEEAQENEEKGSFFPQTCKQDFVCLCYMHFSEKSIKEC